MKNTNKLNLAILEDAMLNELSPVEESMITGGNAFTDFFTKSDSFTKDISYAYNKAAGGVKRFGQGLKDGNSSSVSRYDDLWYNLGYGSRININVG